MIGCCRRCYCCSQIWLHVPGYNQTPHGIDKKKQTLNFSTLHGTYGARSIFFVLQSNFVDFLFLLFIFLKLKKAGTLKKKMSYLFRMLNEFDAECLVNHVRESLTNKKSVKSSNGIHSLPPNSPTHTHSQFL